MPPLLIIGTIAAVVAGVGLLRSVGVRLVHGGRPWAIWLIFGPIVLVFVYGLWVQVRGLSGPSGWTQIPTILFMAVATGLLIRAIRSLPRERAAIEDGGWIGNGPMFDFIVWSVLGIPIVLVVELLLLALAGDLR